MQFFRLASEAAAIAAAFFAGIEMTDQDSEGHDSSARRDRYLRYIASSAWRNNPARLAELEASGMRCRICNASAEEAELQVHHRTYERLEHELAEDLTTLCAGCHLDFTLILRGRRYASRIPKRADVPCLLVNQPKVRDPFHGEANGERLRFLALDRRPPAVDACRPVVRPLGSDLARAREDYRKAAENRL
ncbi:hypothetical protein GWG65_23720 [Bradyrhizobium sp. CSA207]|uniref:hypothetical protein n=1 Tax=Bradyrhizobium sp. CSA207 TaxID=2698826 RepID=UPI0023AF4D2A|nr:hypothetical protein [Bradyrhizobium sp. CSA207]MDE5444403.1 hypothetical protein [Bradyrhizobium sp. CSA207]